MCVLLLSLKILETKAIPYETITASINYVLLELENTSATDDQEISIKGFLEGCVV